MNLSGKTVVYVAGFGGIGYASCKILASKGVKDLIILDLALNADCLKAIQEINPSTHFIAFDISSGLPAIRQTISDILAKFGTIDVWVNGAGIANESAENLPKLIQVNLEGPINVTIALKEKFDKRSGGKGELCVVNIASAVALDPMAEICVYSATKAGLLAFGKACSKLYEESGISYVTVCPGVTNTPILRNMHSIMVDTKAFQDGIQLVPMQTADECGENLVKVIEMNKNGSIWLLESAEMKLIENQLEWTPYQG